MMMGVKISILSQMLFICRVRCEWIEITRIERKTEASTETNHESFMIKPNIQNFTISTRNLDLSSTSPNNNEYTESSVYFVTESIPLEKEHNVDDDPLQFDSASVLRLFKQVNDNVMSFNENRLDDKIKHLEELRDKLSFEIRNRIKGLWNNDERERGRSYLDYNDGMEFPSNEGALMSIGFLTFSVFLIKLVLKLIYTLKYKQRPDFPPASSTTPPNVFLRRNGRAIEDQIEETVRVLHYIQEEPVAV